MPQKARTQGINGRFGESHEEKWAAASRSGIRRERKYALAHLREVTGTDLLFETAG
jgi:hypothetical protein